MPWEVGSLAKAGTPSIIGVYPLTMNLLPIGAGMGLRTLVRSGVIDPAMVLTEQEPPAA